MSETTGTGEMHAALKTALQELLPEMLRGAQDYDIIIYGALMILMVMFRVPLFRVLSRYQLICHLILTVCNHNNLFRWHLWIHQRVALRNSHFRTLWIFQLVN